MYRKLCRIIQKHMGKECLLSITESLSEFTPESFLTHMIFTDHANEFIEILLQEQDEEIYWLIWDHIGWPIQHMPNPPPLTREFQLRFRTACAESENAVYHVTLPAHTARLCVAPMDEASAAYLVAQMRQHKGEDNFVWSLSRYSDRGRLFFVLKTREDDTPVGYVGLALLKFWGPLASENTCNLEYYISADHRGKGYLKEGAAKVVNMALRGEITVQEDAGHPYVMERKQLMVDMIKITCDIHNTASYRSALALGFEEEGIISLVRDGKIYREHWLSRKRTRLRN